MKQSPLDQLLTAVVKYIDEQQKGPYATIDLMNVLIEQGYKASVERDGDVDHYRELEAENAELRRRLRAQGISDKVA